VFIVSDFGGESCDEILAITESLPGYPAPSREAGKGTAGDAGAGFTASSFGGYEQGCGTLRSQGGDLGGGSETLAVNAAFSDGSQTSSSLTTRCHDQFMPDKGNFCAVIQAQSTGSDPDLMATLCAKDNDKIGSNQWVKEGTAIIEGVDWYNNAVTGDINHTLKIGGDVPGVIEQKETYYLQGGGETSQSSQGSGVNKDVAFTLNGLDKHGVAYEDKKSMSFAPSDLKRGFGQKPEIELSGTLKKEHNDQSPHVVTSQQGGEGVGVAHVSHGQARECKDVVPPLMAHSGPNRHGEGSASTTEFTAVTENLTVRRLTPIECERLQGFPDNWTSEKMELILEGNEWKATGKVVKQADGPRYKAMGNAVTVNVAEWIGKQIGKVLS
jgi:DNA (cytosine-5)-methyltransferase 1